MLRIRLTSSSTRPELRDWHEQMAASDDQRVALALGEDLHPLTPGQHSAWMQLVLTWGQNMEGRVLELTPAAAERVRSDQPLSDVEVVALHLAEQVTDGDDYITAEMKTHAREALASRKVLSSHLGDGPTATWTILLSAQTFTNRTSPDLHAPWNGDYAVEETARTLYHDLWPTPKMPVRPPLLEFNEIAVPEDRPTHVTRRAFPAGHPAENSGPFRNLGQRGPRVRGIALALATKVRQQLKPVHDEVGEILFELVQNTQWHATDLAGGRTGANCRSVTFREYSYDPNQIAAATAFDPSFVGYVRDAARLAQREIGRSVTRAVFGTATIIDSGVGLARSVAVSLNEEHLLTEETEISYLIAALAKNLKRRRVDLGDIGLARVQQSLTNLNGFMSIRTGTVEVLRNFVDRPFEPLSEHARKAPPPLILDWIPPRPEDFIVGPRLGTSVTVVYPVDFEVAP